MAKRMKKVKNKRRTHCASCENCFMAVRDPFSISRKMVVCKKIPESMRYGAGHYAGTIIPRYCSMFVEKSKETLFSFGDSN